tara:strand:- start:2565 stop:4220 length:1656 start_codon:yes stop_codon:yes gene_type:complete
MTNKYLLFILLSTLLVSQNYDSRNSDLGNLEGEYRVWVYFVDKVYSEQANITLKAQQRRLNNKVRASSLWYDLNVSSIYKDQISALGLTIKNESRWLNAVSLLCGLSDLKRIKELPFVVKIEPVLCYKKKKVEEISNMSSSFRDSDYGNSQAQIEQINVHQMHNLGYTGSGVRILVMDTGFDLSHISLDQINVIGQWDVINDDTETANETEDEESNGQDFHGTAVLSTIASNIPGEFIGVAYDAEFLLAKTEDVSQEIQIEEDNYIAGLEWGEANGADVVTTSLGYLDWYEYEDLDGNTAVTTIAVDIAVGLGMVCVTAAGNEGNNDWYYIIAPADADSIISVGALWESGEIASFSSHGPTYDGRIKPEVCARGRQTWCVNPNSTTAYTQLSGTSLACPLVGGAAALIRQARPSWTAMEVREAIMMTASMSDSANNTYGHGIMNTLAAIDYETTVGVDSLEILPIGFELINAYPNPFNPSLIIEISVPLGTELELDIISYDGRFIENLYEGVQFERVQKLTWYPKNISSGIYFIRSIRNGKTKVKKVTYIK